MTISASTSLAPITTFRIGGPADFFVAVETEDELVSALVYAHERGLAVRVLGGGSNVLVRDAGVRGMVVAMRIPGITRTERGEEVLVEVGAGVSWETLVDTVVEQGLWGVENLAGIPGTVGGAVVQNIGAYGAELSETFMWADAVSVRTGEKVRVTRESAAFAYRDSLFKKNRDLIIVCVALAVRKDGAPRLTYPDLAKRVQEGFSGTTPREVAALVREIRSHKFPDLARTGTAGSFFKNPIVSEEVARALRARFPGLREFPHGKGSVKIALAWVLDHVLGLKGLVRGHVRLFEKQPLVIVGEDGATAHEVDMLAQEVAQRVQDATGIMVEREVETFGA